MPVHGPLPFARGAFDLVYLNALHATPDLPAVAAEAYRVLKPGGKLFALFPARRDVGYWQARLLPLLRLYWSPPADPAGGEPHTAHSARAALAGFADFRVCKRHLRRTEVPPPWRLVPTPWLERLVGRVLAVRAFKPLAAAREGFSAAA